jgi:hypothetical protein
MNRYIEACTCTGRTSAPSSGHGGKPWLARRKLIGDIPRYLLRIRERWLWSANPDSVAISAIGRSVCRSRWHAASRRSILTCSPTEQWRRFRNVRATCTECKCTISANSVSDGGLQNCSRRVASTRSIQCPSRSVRAERPRSTCAASSVARPSTASADTASGTTRSS